MKLAAQVRLAPGRSISEKVAFLAEVGFEAVELQSDAACAVDEYRSALQAAGISALSMCPVDRGLDLVCDQFTQRRRIQRTFRILDACNELGVKTLISVPIRGSLPVSTAAEDEKDSYVYALEQLAPAAESAGVTIVVEPLNRYETHLVNTLADGCAIARRVGSPAIKVLADIFHMNIEETDLTGSIRATGEWIGHVHLADNHRAQPGTGSIEFADVFTALRDIAYAGSAALECRLRGDPAQALTESINYLVSARGEFD